MTCFYNERDPYAAEWLRNLIAAGHIAPGVVSEDDIRDLRPIDLEPYVQCHFFAGIGVWSYALRRADWPDTKPVWTGSCPCQPFSAAGQRGGEADERHLWPHFHWLIDQCRPPVVLGEQVASKDGLAWLDLVQADLEASNYAFGASDLCAAGFGGAHIRQRLYFVGVADTDSRQRAGLTDGEGGQSNRQTSRRQQGNGSTAASSSASGLEHTALSGQHERSPGGQQSLCDFGNERDEGTGLCDPGEVDPRWAHVDWLLCRNPAGEPSWRPVEPGTFSLAHGVAARMGKLRAYGNALDAETASQFVAGVMEALPMVDLLS